MSWKDTFGSFASTSGLTMPFRQLYEWMDSRGFNMSYSDYAVRLDLVYRCKGITEAEEYFNARSEPAKNNLTHGALLNSYCMEKMSDKALNLFAKMKELNFVSSALVYNNLMGLYMKVGQPEKVPPLMQEMTEQNILPDVFTYNILMNSYASLKDFDAIERIMKEIETRGKAVCDWTIYSTLAAVYVTAGLSEKAELALQKLESLGPFRDRMAYHFLISLYAGTSNLEKVKAIWNSLQAAFPKTTNMSYLVILQALARLDDFDGLKDCFEEWESVCSSYDIRLVNVLIGAYLRRDMIEEAKLLIERSSKRGAGANFRTLEMFIEYYLEKRQIDLAMEYFNTAVSRGKQNVWQPNQQKVAGFLKYYEEEKDVDGAEEFYKKLKTVNYVNEEVYAYLLRTYIAAGKSNPLFRQQMKDDEIETNSETEKLLERVC
ncbi:large ribosomal subunit protein mL101 (rPPR4)-like isoform X2 [Aristolochia californica]|uniref:large ribosomal subunit protein mL101 (rPPR4)-like isoform X2 n=1 Tax=Aristolochia californica TaxID=171875 RepID=UPI0035E1032E